jgi:hypothetical protein
MISFLEKEIQSIYATHQDKIDEISIIIPNKRAAVYIQKYLAKAIQKPFFSPELLTINEWIDQHTPEAILSSTELLFIVHEVHCQIEGDAAETFEKFAQWGKTIISDFDEIDRYLVSPDSLFRNLKHIKEIEHWSFDAEELSDGQERFQYIWDKLIDYYKLFNELLIKKNATYAGKAYANFLNRIDELEHKKHYYFLGFNALSKSEERIMAKLKKDKKATIAFDVDNFYFSNPAHEAGYFYRKISTKWGIRPEVSKQFNSIPKEFQIIETSQQITQTKVAGSIVNDLINEGASLEKTAIVLADESLLIPLTKSLPLDLKEANITMGYPIKFSHLKGLIDLIFEFQFNFQKFKSEKLYHKTLFNLLQHPYIREVINNDSELEKFQNYIQNRNLVFIDFQELRLQIPAISKLEKVLSPWTIENDIRLNSFNELVETLYLSFKSKPKKDIDLEIIYHFSKGFKRFQNMWDNYKVDLSLRGFKHLFYQFWQNESLSFLGNPIDGLQVMGILETRTLDFENIIVLGMNEGNLPKSNAVNTFIPRDLRLHENQLPTEEDRQAIFAHHFYRLLHRSKKVFFTYNSNADGIGTGEKSRFLIQLANEIDTSRGHELKHFTHSAKHDNAQTEDSVYKSTPKVQEKLDELFAYGLSPSALNKFIMCPLDFYYRYILDLTESSEVEENIESSTFGTKIHDVLERIIRDNFLQDEKNPIPLEIGILQKEKKKATAYLEEAYLQKEESKKGTYFTKSDLKYGQNKLSFDISNRFILSFLDKQIKQLKTSKEAVIPVALELKENFDATFKPEIFGKKRTVKIKGQADRIDKKGDVFRIIDYKSGTCDKDKVQLPKKIFSEGAMHDFLLHDKKGYARQLMMYALMFRHSFPEHKKFSAGIISMVNINEWVQNVCSQEVDEVLNDEILDLFQAELLALITKMYDPEFIFQHNPKAKYCEHCGV